MYLTLTDPVGKAGGGAARQTLISSFVVPSPKLKTAPLETPLSSTPVVTDQPVPDATEDHAGAAQAEPAASTPEKAEINNGHAETAAVDSPKMHSPTTAVCLPPKKSRRRLLEEALCRRRSSDNKVVFPKLFLRSAIASDR